QQVNRSVPVVFALVADPVGAGFVDSLARPGGNATGFMLYEYSISGKWLELLKEIAPGVTRVAVLRDPTIPTGPAQFSTIQAQAHPLGVQVNPVNARNANEVENRIATFARTPNGGLIVTGTPAVIYRHLIIKLAAQYKLPAIYGNLTAAVDGGLISYAPDRLDPHPRAGRLLPRIPNGGKTPHPARGAPPQYRTG